MLLDLFHPPLLSTTTVPKSIQLSIMSSTQLISPSIASTQLPILSSTQLSSTKVQLAIMPASTKDILGPARRQSELLSTMLQGLLTSFHTQKIIP